MCPINFLNKKFRGLRKLCQCNPLAGWLQTLAACILTLSVIISLILLFPLLVTFFYIISIIFLVAVIIIWIAIILGIVERRK